MKNLKLIQVFQKKAVNGDSFCLDYDDNIYFSSNTGIYSCEKDSFEAKFCSEIDSNDQEQQHHVIGMEYIVENNSIFIASSSGNLFLYDFAEKQVSNIGIVDSGLLDFAWSPDQEFLILLTGQKTFVLMTREFDPITEKNLSAEEFGKSKPINVGWGSKTTQFHGSEGKGAALVKQKEPTAALPYDDHLPRICWRGDGEYFVISSIDDIKGYRKLRVWSKDAVLQFTSEILEGIEEPLSWRPSGDFITCSQQCPDKHKIIFVEKNGLKHLEFSLPFEPNTHRVTTLSWSPDSSTLAVAVKNIKESSEDFQVMLWSVGNYHWYLKQKISFPFSSPQKNFVLKWNIHKHLEMNCFNQGSQYFHSLKWIHTLFHSPPQYECEDSLVLSVDAENILVSPFGKLVVPPPMCGYKFTMSSSVQSIFFAPDKPAFGAYLGNYTLAIFSKVPENLNLSIEKTDCKFQVQAAGGNGFKSQVKPYNFDSLYRIVLDLNTHESFWSFCLSHWTWIKNNLVLCVCSYSNDKKTLNSILLMDVNSSNSSNGCQEISARCLVDLNNSVIAMCTNEKGSVIAVQFDNGEVHRIDIGDISKDLSKKNNVLQPWKKPLGGDLLFSPPSPEMCIVNTSFPHDDEFIAALAPNGDFEFQGLPPTQFVTSYFVQDGFLLFTTTNHTLTIHQFDVSKKNGKQFPDSEQKIERNAKIIFVPPSSTKVILQMPRGNLETIHPRALVLSAIFDYLDRLEYYKAFELAKIHRIDLNVLCDYNPKKFLENIGLITEQLQSKDLNLFLACLKFGNICKETYHLQMNILEKTGDIEESTFFENKLNILCEKIREALDPNNKDHLQSYLASYALMKPSKLDQALLKIKSIKDSGSLESTQQIVNQALDFLLYLVDVNELIDVAFGTYDLETTIMVAQKSQKDPKEFLPFYNDLRKLDENYRKYKIDMHLNRYKKALQHISKCTDQFEECLKLVKEKKLFVDALYLFPSSSEQNKSIWTEYGEYLYSKGYFDEAGLVFSRVEANESAFKAYRENANWKEAIDLAYKLDYPESKVIGTCQHMVERLKDKNKYLEAGHLLEYYIKDIEEAVVTLIEGCEWSSALHLMSKYKRFDIADTHLQPALIMLHKTFIPTLENLLNNFKAHLARLKYLRSPEKKKLDEEVALASRYVDDDQYSEVTSVSDFASSRSESTRLSGSIMTRKSSKSRRKQQLKKYRLKEGSPDEDLALIVALAEIVRNVDVLKDNFLSHIRVLVQHGFDSQAQEMQSKMQQLVSLIDKEMSYIWPPSNQCAETPSQWSFGPESTANTITASRKVEEKNPSSIPQDPQLAAPPWRKIDTFLNMLRIDFEC